MRVFVTAGEPSGDRLAAALFDGLQALAGTVEAAGVGGPMLQARGVKSLFPMQELSVMGLAEVLPNYTRLRRRIAETAAAAVRFAPDLMLTVDSPDFSFRVLDRMPRHAGVRRVHYVAPSVWAWRPGRARRLAGRVDQVLALLPFEPPYFEAVGLDCDFVGHPVAVEAPPPADDLAALRAETGGAAPLVVVLPGSRAGEVRRLAPVLGDALRPAAARHRGLGVVVPTLPHLSAQVREAVRDWPVAPLVVESAAARRAALWLADVALTKSGTVSLELAAAGTPMVVAHDVAPLTRWILGRMLRVDTVTLVNLVSETRAVPEFLGRDCRADRIAPALLDLIARPEAQARALSLTMQRLGRGGEAPGLRAARAVLAGLRRA